MDSLDAQCLVIQLLEGEIPLPELWRHDRSGALTYAYEGSDRSFTWPAESVADMARRWRDSDQNLEPERVRSFLDAHNRLQAMATEAGLGHADTVIHHLGRAELRGVWEQEKVVLVVERIGEGASAQA